jgi:hypothetical protein
MKRWCVLPEHVRLAALSLVSVTGFDDPMHQLAELVKAWPTLPAHVRLAISALADTVTTGKSVPVITHADDLDKLPWEKRDGQ